MDKNALKQIHTHVLIINATRDKFHNSSEISSLSEYLPNSTEIDMKLFSNTRGSEMANLLLAHINNQDFNVR
jgi:hypothetical protein